MRGRRRSEDGRTTFLSLIRCGRVYSPAILRPSSQSFSPKTQTSEQQRFLWTLEIINYDSSMIMFTIKRVYYESFFTRLSHPPFIVGRPPHRHSCFATASAIYFTSHFLFSSVYSSPPSHPASTI